MGVYKDDINKKEPNSLSNAKRKKFENGLYLNLISSGPAKVANAKKNQ